MVKAYSVYYKLAGQEVPYFRYRFPSSSKGLAHFHLQSAKQNVTGVTDLVVLWYHYSYTT